MKFATRSEINLATRLIFAITSIIVGVALLYNAWTFTTSEDSIPVFSCHTMGNFECGPNAPWHGITITTME